MGQVCSGEKPEARKAGGLDVPDEGGLDHFSTEEHAPQHQQQHQQPQHSTVDEPTSSKEDAERLKELREEQARLDLIVSAAGRGMVAVRSTRGSTGYYDQGFAAALAQHLEQTTQFPNQLEVRLPPPSSSSILSLYERLSQPQWEGIALGPGGGLAGCAGENPIRYMDNVAESLLDSVVPAKQQLFAGSSPMVENLL
jgi:hypothetical protein